MAVVDGMPAQGGVPLLLDLPFAPGEAPYRVKGNAYLGHYAYLESHYPGGEAAHHAALEQLHPVRGPKLRAVLLPLAEGYSNASHVQPDAFSTQSSEIESLFPSFAGERASG